MDGEEQDVIAFHVTIIATFLFCFHFRQAIHGREAQSTGQVVFCEITEVGGCSLALLQKVDAGSGLVKRIGPGAVGSCICEGLSAFLGEG